MLSVRSSKTSCVLYSLKEDPDMTRDLYNYKLTSDEDCCLMMMLEFFEDLGLPDDFNQKAFESLSSKFYDNLK